jgi:hypothetical protein
MHNLGDESLNGRKMLVLKCYPTEGKMVVDATAEGGPAERVRHVKVPVAKILSCEQHDDPTMDDLAVTTFMSAKNRDDVLTDAGFSIDDVWCVPVRPHPDVKMCMAFTHVPALVDRFNTRDGAGWSCILGHSLFAFGYEHETKGSAIFSNEMTVIVRDPRGCYIDVSPDIASGDTSDIKFKMFVPEKYMVAEDIPNLNRLIGAHAMMNWTNATPDADESDIPMLPKTTPIAVTPDGVLCEPTLIYAFPMGQGYTGSYRSNSDLRYVYEQRRGVVAEGGVTFSLKLARNLVAKRPELKIGSTFCVRGEIQNQCFGCHTRCLPSELEVCVGCGKATYCSHHCRKFHLPEHRSCCASPEERRRRVEAAVAAAREAAERRATQEKHAAREAAERHTAELEHRARVAASRATPKKEKPFTASGPSHKPKTSAGVDALPDARTQAKQETKKAVGLENAKRHAVELKLAEEARIAVEEAKLEQRRVGRAIGGA